MVEDIRIILLPIEKETFCGDMPDEPDNCIALYHTSGDDPSSTFDGLEYEKPCFQIRIRDKAYLNGTKRANAIKDLLRSVKESAINGSKYILIEQQGDLQDWGKDKNGRSEFSLNYKVRVKRGGI